MSKKADNSCPVKKTSIGGQALMEGIMMRGPEITAMAVRNTKGEMIVEKFPTESKKRAKFFKLPVIRGVFNYIDSMTMGTQCLMRSAEIAGLEEAEEEMKLEKAAKKAAKANGTTVEEELENLKALEAQKIAENDAKQESGSSNNTRKKSKKNTSSMTGFVMFLSVALGICVSVLLFILVPSYLYKLLTLAFPALAFEHNLALQSLVKSVFEGILKIAILVGYMAAVSLMKDIKRTFMFHGAEHKTIFCYEHGLELTVENVRKQKRFHPRCGTSFLILMLLVGIFVSFFIDPLFLLIFGYLPATIVRVLIKLALLPLIVGVGYELIKIAGRHNNLFTKIISAPGVWLQHVTVLEPTDDMIECAITAVKEVIPENGSDNW